MLVTRNLSSATSREETCLVSPRRSCDCSSRWSAPSSRRTPSSPPRCAGPRCAAWRGGGRSWPGVCFVVGIAVMMTGVVANLIPVGIIGFLVMLASATMGLTALRGQRTAGPEAEAEQPGPAPRGPPLHRHPGRRPRPQAPPYAARQPRLLHGAHGGAVAPPQGRAAAGSRSRPHRAPTRPGSADVVDDRAVADQHRLARRRRPPGAAATAAPTPATTGPAAGRARRHRRGARSSDGPGVGHDRLRRRRRRTAGVAQPLEREHQPVERGHAVG